MNQNNLSAHEKIVDLLKTHGRNDLRGGVQLFTDQYDNYWSISVNYNGTGIHISKDEIDTNELIGDELIKVCKTWTHHE